jgi:protein involved in polysaccharide export with SLBB domain
LLLFPVGVLAVIGCETLGITPPANKLLDDAKDIRATAPVPAPVPRELAKELFASYIIEPSDVLLVQPADLDAPLRLPPDQTVLADGTIDLGIYGRPVVSGKTQEQIAADVKQLINAKDKPKEPIAITVRLISRNTKVFYVLGEVNAPGAFPISGFETVLDGIIKAGGVTRHASEQNMILSRPTPPDGCRVVYPVCYPQIVQLGDTSTNYQLQAGDRIYVPSRGMLEGLLPARCKRGGPCNRLQIGCWSGSCSSTAGTANGLLPAPTVHDSHPAIPAP